MKKSVALCLVLSIPTLAFGLLSCDDGGGGGDPDGVKPVKTELLDEGTGDPNTEPLWPLRTGSAWYQHDGDLLLWIDAPRRLGDATVFPAVGASQVDWYEAAADGVLYHGNSRAGRKPRPVLWIPATVRAGMRWHSWLGGAAPQVLSEVTSVAEEDTLWGPRRVWEIRREDLLFGDVTVSRYAEGRGPVDSALGTYFAVLPLEDAPSAPPERLTLSPLNGGAPVLVDRSARHVSVVDEGTGAPMARIEAGKAVQVCTIDGCRWQVLEFVNCLRIDPMAGAATLDASDLGVLDAPCTDALGAAPDGQGQWHRRDLWWRGAFLTDPMFNPIGPDMALYAGMIRAGDRILYFGGADRGRLGFGAAVTETRYDWESASLHPFAQPVSDHFNERFYSHVTALLPLSPDPALTGLAVAEPHTIWFARLVGGALRDLGPARHPTGRISSFVNAAGRRFFVIGEDGRVEELVPEPDGARQRHVADVELPAGHLLAGVVPAQDGFLVFTHRLPDPDDRYGDDGHPLQGDLLMWRLQAPAGQPARIPAVTSLRAWVSEKDVEVCWAYGHEPETLEGWTLAGEPATAVRSRADDSCVLVRRDEGAGADLAAPGAFAAEGPVPGVGRVAFGFREVAELDARRRDVFAHALPWEWHAPATDGMIVTPAYLYGPAGTVAGSVAFAEDTDGFGWSIPMVPDLSGAGPWRESTTALARCPEDALNRCTGLALALGPGSPYHFPYASELGQTILGPAWDGGVLVRWSDRPVEEIWDHMLYAHVHTDGSVTELPTTPFYSVRWQALLAGDRVCRMGEQYQEHIFCEDPSEGAFEIPVPRPEFIPTWFPVSGTAAWTLGAYRPDTGRFTPVPSWHAGTYGWLFVDTDARTATPFAPEELFPLAAGSVSSDVTLQYDAAARLYGLATWRAEDGRYLGWDLFRFTADGALEIFDVEALRGLFDPDHPPELLPPSDEFFFLAGAVWRDVTGGAGVVRVPRSRLEK